MPGDLFRGTRVRLAAVEPRDIPTITRWYGDGQFMRLFDADAAMPKTEREVTETITGQQKSQTAFVFAIRPLDRDCHRRRGASWAGLRDRGHATAARFCVWRTQFAPRVQLTVFSYNTAAMALYERIGFTQEGVFREFVLRDGQLHDMLLYGLLRREWEALRDG